MKQPQASDMRPSTTYLEFKTRLSTGFKTKLSTPYLHRVQIRLPTEIKIRPHKIRLPTPCMQRSTPPSYPPAIRNKARILCGSFLRKCKVFAYFCSIENLKDLSDYLDYGSGVGMHRCGSMGYMNGAWGWGEAECREFVRSRKMCAE